CGGPHSLAAQSPVLCVHQPTWREYPPEERPSQEYRGYSGNLTFLPDSIEDFAFRRPPSCLSESQKHSGNLAVIREWWAQWWAHSFHAAGVTLEERGWLRGREPSCIGSSVGRR